MISTRRIAAAVGLAAGLAGLTLPTANAAEAAAPPAAKAGVATTLDALVASGVPEPQRDQVPPLYEQVPAVKQLGELTRFDELQQLIAPAAPGLAVLPAVR
ncbi:hypothetical protein GCM10010503_56200 [Streptomyces lucensis JCM 4490]|uniref:Secreted protein n=1 Tax=Streptomyces lucensis JCM 4490 TaxID=1306176 RepID=A0A918JCQ5_9ACTN|nr:hypothetical protein [Streptomyces lucensis]GGW71527.1 hypothetical protein GCM10010503_56200 [Streptomyces lucensis JCM 4490]